MKINFTSLRDPETGDVLTLSGEALQSKFGTKYQIQRGVPRFVDPINYSKDFGDQWNMFPKTQLDSFTGSSISESRLKRCLKINLEDLKGNLILEAGSGAGRFTEILLKYGSIVHSFDYSSAVDANFLNNGSHENLTLVQADIRKIPFPKKSYDYVICLGVLQHTPSPEESIKSLWQMVRPGGILVIDHYEWQWRTVLPFGGSRAPFTRQLVLLLPRKYRFKFIKKLTDFWFPLQWKFKDSSLIRRLLIKFSPVAFHYPYVKLLNRNAYYEWALLDTHDATTDYYQHLRTSKQIKSFLESLNAIEVVVTRAGNGVEAFCKKPI
jgi:SAM-dependent methyltransferase